MSRVPYTVEQLKKLGLVEKDGVYVPVKSLVAKKVEKISILETTEGATYNPNSFINGHAESPFAYLHEKEIVKTNKKVRNATKSEVNGVKFDSNLEKYMYGLLQGAGIDFEFQKVYVLQEKFSYRIEAVRAVTLTVDFYLPTKNMIIDTKGYANDVAPLKYKLLKWHLYLKFQTPVIELPSTKKECDLLLSRLLYDTPKT